MAKILNFTPHTINIMNEYGGKIQDFPSEGNARVSTSTQKIGTVGDIDLFSKEYGQVEGLPPQENDQFIIVSRLVAAAVPHREDLVFPSGFVRNESGQIIGCLGFERI